MSHEPDTYVESNLRFVLTYDTGKGYRSLAFGSQGRHTYPTEAAALEQLRAVRENNTPKKLSSIFGELGAASLRVEPVECWPGHNDPKRTTFPATDPQE
jgi:hypothetical protein